MLLPRSTCPLLRPSLYASSLNHTKLKQYLKQLIADGEIVNLADQRTYRSTVKGRTFVRDYEECQKLQLALRQIQQTLMEGCGVAVAQTQADSAEQWEASEAGFGPFKSEVRAFARAEL